jgi:teichuronic acid biosynthesis glycosyltransferase TuaC
MKVLFICSGNSANGISMVVKNQGISLEKAGIEVHYYTINGKGLKGYLSNVYLLRKNLAKQQYDLCHAHYSLSGFITAIAMLGAGVNPRKKLIVSLMGSDLFESCLLRFSARFFHRHLWARTIVKSKCMKDILESRSAIVLANGVDLERFFPSDRDEAKKRIGFDDQVRMIVFIGDIERPEKNYELAAEAVRLLGTQCVDLITLSNKNCEIVPYYLNAADLLLSTSLWEGSANVLKEALACNIPVVVTNVGDADEIIEGVGGCFLASFDPVDIAEKINSALNYGRATRGRDKLIEMGLDSVTVARRIKELYIGVLKEA